MIRHLGPQLYKRSFNKTVNYKSLVEFDSKLFPGLHLKLRKMSAGRRADYRVKTADVYTEIRKRREPVDALLSKEKELDEDDKTGKEEIDREVRQLQLDTWNEVIVPKLYPSLIRWGVAEVSGVEVDGEPVTIDNLLEKIPEDIVVEIGAAIDRIIGLSFEEQMLFESPSTSSAQVDGQTKNTSAPVAEANPISSTLTATVVSTIQN